MTRNQSTLCRASTIAIAMALATPAAAQSFNATVTPPAGASVTTGAGTTDITLTAAQTVLDWTPTDNATGVPSPIDFQGAGTTATFSSASDFAVLNRINVADTGRAIGLNGTINGLVNGVTGGSIYFYSPSGFVIGSGAVVNVGSLVLSASPIAVDGTTGDFINGGTVAFGQALNPNAAIVTNAGSQINANGSGSYVALVAPSITHRGIIRTDAAAALVAAEAATITFSPDGLFDIQVTTGTDAANGIDIDGGTITRGAAVEGASDHRAYLVAVAKNDAVAMLVRNGGSVGFETATSATVEDNAVVLSAGYDVGGGLVSFPSGTSTVSVSIDRATMSSDTRIDATGNIGIGSASGATAFGGDLHAGSLLNTLVDAQNGNTLSIAGNVDLIAGADGNAAGKFARLGAQGGSTLTVGGDVSIVASSYAPFASGDGENGASVTGGNAHIVANGGSTISIAGSANLYAEGYGGDVSSNATGGTGIGGQAMILANDGNSQVNIDGAVYGSAQGFGGSTGECSACVITGGIGQGGTVNFSANTGTGNELNFGSDVELNAAGNGGAGDVVGGLGKGGFASFNAGNGSSITVLADTLVDATGYGGYGFDGVGGLGLGGRAIINSYGDAASLVDLAGPVVAVASGIGGDGATGGTGTGGEAGVMANLGTLHARGSLSVSSQSVGGTYSGGGNGGGGLADPDGTDITQAYIFSGGGTLIVDGLTTVDAIATGGDGSNGGNGGNAQAGFASIHAGNNDLATSVIQLGDVVVTSDAQGGAGGNGSGGTNGGDGGNGGNAIAGRAIITAAAGSGDLTAAATIASASATGGNGGQGGGGDGGTGGNGGNGGTATGGLINVGTESGNTNLAQAANNGTATYDTIIAIASATGGNGGDAGFGLPDGVAGSGGAAFGGQSVLLVRGSLVTVGAVSLDSSATGGDGGLDPLGSPQGAGGNATTGQVGVLVTNRFQHPDQRGTLSAGIIAGTANATGGTGGVNGAQLSSGGLKFQVLNSDATIGSVSLTGGGDAYDPLALIASPTLVEVQNGTVGVSGSFQVQTLGDLAMWADNGTLTAGSIAVDADNFVHDPTQSAPLVPGLYSAGSIALTTGQDLIVDANLTSTNGVGFGASGLVKLGDVRSVNGAVAINAGSTLDAGDVRAAGGIFFQSGGDMNLGNVQATAGGLDATSLGGSATFGNVNTGTFLVVHANGGITAGNLTAGANVLADAQSGSLSLGDVSGNGIELDATGSILAGDLNSASYTVAHALGGSLTVGNVDAATFIVLDANGAMTSANLTAGSTIDLLAVGDILFGNVDAGTVFDSESENGGITGGDVIAGVQAGGNAQGAIVLGDVTGGGNGASADGFSVGFASASSISVGNVQGTENVGFATFGPLTTGTVNSGGYLLGLASGNMSFGAITTAAQGQVYLGDASMFVSAGGPDNFDPSLVLAQAPVTTSGSISISGPVSTGQFRAAAGSGLTTGAITAQTIQASAGGTATLNGVWSAGAVALRSNDIAIANTGGINAGPAGSVLLASTNATQMQVGDGLTAAGYQLSSAEFGRVSGGSVLLAGRGDASAAADMLVGDLGIAAPANPNGLITFATGDIDTQVTGGVIRVVGDVLGSNFQSGNRVEFATGRFELDAATGSVRLEGAPGTLGGILDITADRIHVASGAILDQLAANPAYAGRENDLNAPAATSRPDGVLSASTIWVSPMQAVLVQNTGTADVPAGFKANQIELFAPEGAPAGSIELIVNGQLVTPGGTLTGQAVRDALVVDTDLSVYSANSSVNSCPLVGDCVPVPNNPFPPDFTPTPGIQDEVIQLVDQAQPPPPPFGNEEVIDDNDEGTEEGKSSPITPPAPLFDTTSLTDRSDVDDPVSGSGNPALMDSPPPPPSGQENQQ